MRVRITGGKITAEPETAEDMTALLAYMENGRTVSRLHKKACPKYGKRVKHMESHTTIMHGKGRMLGAVRGDMAKV